MNRADSHIEDVQRLPILTLVNGVYASLSRNPLVAGRAGLFPFLLVFTIGLWQTPEHWGPVGYYAMRAVEFVLLLAFWTFYAIQLQRFVLKGPVEGAPSFLPRLDLAERRFAIASAIIFVPFTAFAIWYKQPLFFQQPDLVIMGGMTALDGVSELLYTSLVAGWLIQLFAFVLPAISVNDARPLKELFKASFAAKRNDFSRLFAASLLVVLPVWFFFAWVRIVLHMPFFTQMAMGDEASAFAWNMIFYFLETLKVFIAGGLLAMVWALAYGRHRQA